MWSPSSLSSRTLLSVPESSSSLSFTVIHGLSGDKPHVRNLKLQTTCQQMTWSLIVLCLWHYLSNLIPLEFFFKKGRLTLPWCLPFNIHCSRCFFCFTSKLDAYTHSQARHSSYLCDTERVAATSVALMQFVISSFDLLALCWQNHLNQSISLTVPLT